MYAIIEGVDSQKPFYHEKTCFERYRETLLEALSFEIALLLESRMEVVCIKLNHI